MTAPAIVTGHITGTRLVNSTSYTVTAPTHAAGDVIYIAITVDAVASLSLPGWTVLYNALANGNTFVLFYKTATASEPGAYVVTSNVSERAVWIAWAVTGDNGIHAQGTNATGNSATATVPAVTTTDADCLIIGVIATENVTAPMGAMAGNTQLDDVSGISAGSLGVYYLTAASSGTTSSATASLNASDDWLGVRFAVAPTTAPVPPEAAAAAVPPARLPTYSTQQNISVFAFEPLTLGTTQVADLSRQISSYSHEILAFGGYWSARIRIDGAQVDLEEWYEQGLGRRIVAYSPEGSIIWEGFVNIVRLNLSGLSKTIGPVLDVVNRVRMVHSFIGEGGEDIGLRISTDWADDTASQDKYGIIERVLSTGGASVETAEQLRDLYLEDNAQPARSEEWSSGGGDISLEIECAGYVRMMDTYTYTNADTGFETVTTKIESLLDADPNGILSSTNATIETNDLPVAANEQSDRTATNIIKSLAALGNDEFDRCLFGVYANRQAVYAAVVEQTDYLQALSDSGQRVLTPGGAVVAPWSVLPGKWMRSTDFLIGRIAEVDSLNDDPRFLFIESVQFTAPYLLVLRGGRNSRTDQVMARRGLSGIGG